MAKETSHNPTPESTPAAEPAFVAAPVATTNVLSIVSLVTGIAGLTFFPFFGSIAAVITGHISLHQLKLKQEQGRGMALAGLITGYVGLGLIILAIVVMIGFMVVLIQSGLQPEFNGNHLPMRGYNS